MVILFQLKENYTNQIFRIFTVVCNFVYGICCILFFSSLDICDDDEDGGDNDDSVKKFAR